MPARAALLAVLLLALLPASAAAHPGHHHPGMAGAGTLFGVPFPPMGPSAGGYASGDVEFVKNFPQHSDSAGGRKLGDYFYITTERDLTIYDVSVPADPQQVGHLVLPEFGQPVFTEEDPDTNGEILLVGNNEVLIVIDVRDKTAPKVLSTLADADDHTITCVLDCTWAYGSEGTIVDLRDPAHPRLSTSNWQTADIESEHDVTEVSPGIVLTSTQPLKLLDATADPEHPTVIGSTPLEEGRFTHANLWPRGGTDDFLLVGGEAVGPGCSASISASFSTWDARSWRSTGMVRQVDEFRLGPGAPVEGRAPESSFCVHWFDEHPYYANGGLVAIAWYEHGTHFLKIGRDGSISEVGWFLGGGGQASAAYWIDERTVYVADYVRGLDVLQFTGDIGSPPAPAAPAADTPAPAPEPAPAPVTDAASTAPVQPAASCTEPASLRSPKVRTVAGRPAIAGASLLGLRRLGAGVYVLRYRLGGETRRLALRRVRGRWVKRPSYERTSTCGLVRKLRLSAPAFGRRGLGIAYSVTRHASVSVTVTKGEKVVRRFRARTVEGGATQRLRLPGRGLRRGDYRVNVVASSAGERGLASAVSRRL